MPRYGVTTFLNTKEMEILEKAAKKTGLSKYKLLRKGVMSYCRGCLEEEKKENERKSDSGTEERGSGPVTVSY